MATIQQILKPQTLTRVVRQVVSSSDAILAAMGMNPGGRNELDLGHGREGSYHIYNDSRRAAKGRAPGTPAGRSSLQAMSRVPFVYPRMHDSISILGEFVHNLGRIDDPAVRDEGGAQMIARQTRTLSQKAANFRVALVVGMLRDTLYFHESGDDWLPSYTSGSALFNVDAQVPDCNKSQLDMEDRSGTDIYDASIIDVPWTNAGANILDHFAKIDAARAIQGVGPVTDCWLNSITWRYLTGNDYLLSEAGLANPPYTMFQRETGTRPDGTPVHELIGTFGSLPGKRFHISDEGLELWNGSAYAWAKHWPDSVVVMTNDPMANDNFTMYVGSEPIAEYDGGPRTVRRGLSSWSKPVSNPTGDEVYVLDNCLAVNHDPYSVCVATVAGF